MEGAYQRTGKSLRNSAVALTLQVVQLLLGFFSRKLFLDYLGTEVLGLNSTASSLLNFLNLAELGIGNAVAFSLYRPLYDKDEQAVREIVALQGWLYRRVAWFVIGASALAMCFFPLIFTKMQLPMWYAYASFSVLLLSSMLGYFVNYKQAVLTADQKDYKVQLNFRLTMIVKVGFQMAAVALLPHPYVWWLVIEALFAVIAAVLLNRSVHREYPYLKRTVKVQRETLNRYPDLVTKVRQLFVHKVGFYATVQLTPLLIYAFTTLSLVAVYGNYMVLSNSLNSLLVALFISVTASVGNMIAEGNRELILKVFRELFTFRFFVITFSSVILWFLADPFISLWIGEQYLLPRSTLLLIILIFYLTGMYTVMEIYINACGLFRDVWATVVQVVTYLVLAVVLGHFMSLDGVLLAGVIQLVLMTVVWRPYFLFRHGLAQPVATYWLLYGKILLAGGAAIGAGALILRLLPQPDGTVFSFVIYALEVCIFFSVLLFGTLYAVEKGMRTFVERIRKTLKR